MSQEQSAKTTALLQLLACSNCSCKLELTNSAVEARCQQCHTIFKQEKGIWRMLTPLQQQHYQPFVETYRPLRHAEGWERPDANYYLNLPYVPSDDQQAPIWRIRQRSLRLLQQQVGPGRGQWAIDLGAGNGWLSRQLVKWGYQVVALDLNMSGPDSLEGAQLYQQHDQIWFGRVQATMEHLPFQDAVFALAVASGTLHYAALESTLPTIWRTLQPGGRFVITDSPVYKHAAAGQAMVAEYQAKANINFGYNPVAVGGTGFLVEQQLWAELQQHGFEVKQFSIERRLGRLKRLALKPLKTLRKQREQAHFPVIVARKPPNDFEL